MSARAHLSRRRFVAVTASAALVAAVGGYGAAEYHADGSNYMRAYDGARFDAGRLPSGARIELRNGRFVAVVGGRYYGPEVRLVLQDRHILEMPGRPGQASDVAVDLVVDLGGRAVIPGLFNTHCHVQSIQPSLPASIPDSFKAMAYNNLYREWQLARSMADCLAHGITHVRDAWAEDLSVNAGLQAKIERGELPGPRLYRSVLVSQAGGPFAPERHMMDKMMWRSMGMNTVDYARPESGVLAFPADAGAQAVRDAVDRAIDERGAQYIKIYDLRGKRFTLEPGAAFMSLEQLGAAMDQARKRGLRTITHQQSLESFRRAVQVGISTLAHLPFDGPLTDNDIRQFLASGATIEPTLWTAYAGAWAMPGDPIRDLPDFRRLAQHRASTYAHYAGEYWVPALAGRARAGTEAMMRATSAGSFEAILKAYQGILVHGFANLRRLYAAGAIIAAANDAGGVSGSPAMVGPELALFDLVLNGEPGPRRFGGADAVRVATINSARALGVDDRFGTIEPGKVADLAVVDGDPLADPTLVGGRVAALFMDGTLKVNNCGLGARPA